MKTRTLLAAAAAVSAGSSGLLLAPDGGHAQGAGRTLTLENAGLKVSTVDLSPRGGRSGAVSAGDELHATSKIAGDDTGRRHLSCTATRAARTIARATFSCSLTYDLAGGRITASGADRVGGDDPVTLVVTGGTGSYLGANGTVTGADGTDTLELAG